jgi:hypothetical protein
MPLGLVLVAVAAVVGGCASAEAGDAANVASRFATLAGSDPGGACSLLAPRTREALTKEEGDCSAGLKKAGLPPAGTASHRTGDLPSEVAGHSARVVLDGQVVFLARFDDGWRVTAAGCEQRSDDVAVPYDCAVEGS